MKSFGERCYDRTIEKVKKCAMLFSDAFPKAAQECYDELLKELPDRTPSTKWKEIQDDGYNLHHNGWLDCYDAFMSVLKPKEDHIVDANKTMPVWCNHMSYKWTGDTRQYNFCPFCAVPRPSSDLEETFKAHQDFLSKRSEPSVKVPEVETALEKSIREYLEESERSRKMMDNMMERLERYLGRNENERRT